MEDASLKRLPIVKVPSEYIGTQGARDFLDFMKDNLHNFPEYVSEITFTTRKELNTEKTTKEAQ